MIITLNYFFQNGYFEFVLIVPNRVNGLDEVEKSIKKIDFDYKKDFKYQYIDLEIPKFKIESTVELDNPLKHVLNYIKLK